jgi:hypothetical protein
MDVSLLSRPPSSIPAARTAPERRSKASTGANDFILLPAKTGC